MQAYFARTHHAAQQRMRLLQVTGHAWAEAGTGHRKTQSTLYREDAVRRSGVTGPLGVGVVMQSAAPPLLLQRISCMCSQQPASSFPAWLARMSRA